MRLSLTRGEVNKIVLRYLRETGKIPADAKLGATTMPALQEQHGGGYIGPEVEKGKENWEDWICVMFVWKEQVDQ